MAYDGWVYVTSHADTEQTAQQVAAHVGGKVIDLPGTEWGVAGHPIDAWVKPVGATDVLVGFTHSVMVRNGTTDARPAQDAAARVVFERLCAETSWRVALVGDDRQTIVEDRPAP